MEQDHLLPYLQCHNDFDGGVLNIDLNATSAANADTVDGKHASELLNYNNLTNKPTIPSVGNGNICIITTA